jgi:uncharacterized protein (DUF362 family)
MSARVVVSYTTSRDLDALRGMIRSLLQTLTGTTDHNPLKVLVDPGQTVVVKPNMVRHFNPAGSLDAVITEPNVCRIIAELAAQAVGARGHVVIADSPQNDCDFTALLENSGWKQTLRELQAQSACDVELLDMRPEAVVMQDGIIVKRYSLPGDPQGEVQINLATASAFHGSPLDPSKLRGSDYDPTVTSSSHADGSHTYSVCRSFLAADLLIVVPKIKTHKKVGLSLAMKNLVGMVGEKNRLPHHTAGFPSNGGDEYPSPRPWPAARQWAAERARPLLAEGRWTSFFRRLRRVEASIMPEIPERSGNWWGNDTAWRMVVDLVSILRQARADAGRSTMFLYDGLVVGAGLGPLAPIPVNLGLLAASVDPVAGDWAVARELSIEPYRIPLLREAARREVWSRGDWTEPDVIRVTERPPTLRLEPHPGWRNAPIIDS